VGGGHVTALLDRQTIVEEISRRAEQLASRGEGGKL
jgi:hypothetical protein